MTTPVEARDVVAEDRPDDAALFSLLQRLADNKYRLGRLYAEWCTAAPNLEAAVAAAAMAQDEIGHARSHYPLFRRFTGKDVEPEDRDQLHSLAVLDPSFEVWADFVAANFLVDTALSTVFESATESSYDDLRNRARRIVGEEQVHWLHGKGWVKRLAAQSQASEQRLDASLSSAWTEVLMWFGQPDGSEEDELYSRSILDKRPDDLRASFCDRVVPVMNEAGTGRLTEQTAELPWSRWDSGRWRLNSTE